MKRPRMDGILDADDLAFMESGAPSPAQSEMSHGSGKIIVDIIGQDESSNEALVVDCDSPGGPSTPGKMIYLCFMLIVYYHKSEKISCVRVNRLSLIVVNRRLSYAL